MPIHNHMTLSTPDAEARATAEARWDRLAKPLGSLGLLERAVADIAAIQGTADVVVRPRRLIVACADNGVTRQGVAAAPSEITAVMADEIAAGRSAVGRMAHQADCDLMVYDVGMARRAQSARVVDRHLMDGTNDLSETDAMPRDIAEGAIDLGITLAKEAHDDGVALLATGEMGIGNTTTTAALAAVLLNQDPAVTTGRGVGLDDEAYAHKVEVVRRALARRTLSADDPIDALASVGGLDIAVLAGVFLGGAAYRIPVVIDGVISAVAALVAARLCPQSTYAMMASHVSAEPAGRLLLKALGKTPIVHADMRLGEGTGAMTLMPLLDMAVAVYRQMITLDDIGLVL